MSKDYQEQFLREQIAEYTFDEGEPAWTTSHGEG
jgi:hypothetical protein